MLDAVCAKLLALKRPVLNHLSTLLTVRLLEAVGTHLLLAFGAKLLAIGGLGVNSALLLALNRRNRMRPINPGGPDLLALRPLYFGSPDLLALNTRSCRPLNPLGADSGSTAGATLLHGRGTFTAAVLLYGRAVTLGVATRSRSGRGRNRQGGDTRGEEYPGHQNFSFRTARTVRQTHRSNDLPARLGLLARQRERQMSLPFRYLNAFGSKLRILRPNPSAGA